MSTTLEKKMGEAVAAVEAGGQKGDMPTKSSSLPSTAAESFSFTPAPAAPRVEMPPQPPPPPLSELTGTMPSSRGGITVQGSLYGGENIDDSSSSSEEEEEESVGEGGGGGGDNSEDDEEEIEYGDGASSALRARNSSRKIENRNTDNATSRSNMNRTFKGSTNSGSFAAKKPNMSSTSSDTEATFGIAYKPIVDPRKLPPQPESLAERELERELKEVTISMDAAISTSPSDSSPETSTSGSRVSEMRSSSSSSSSHPISQKGEDDDDEFDHDASEIPTVGTPLSSQSPAEVVSPTSSAPRLPFATAQGTVKGASGAAEGEDEELLDWRSAGAAGLSRMIANSMCAKDPDSVQDASSASSVSSGIYEKDGSGKVVEAHRSSLSARNVPLTSLTIVESPGSVEEEEEEEEGEGPGEQHREREGVEAAEAADIWRTLERDQSNAESNAEKNASEEVSVGRLVAFAEAERFFCGDVLEGTPDTAAVASSRCVYTQAQRDTIVPTEGIAKGFTVGSLLRSVPKLRFPRAKEQRDVTFLVAGISFDPADEMHVGMLRLVFYSLLTEARRRTSSSSSSSSSSSHPEGGDAFDYAAMRAVGGCAAFGGHWEAIGFQGSDPRTDLNRGATGMLGVLQALRWADYHPTTARRLLSALGDADRFGTNTFMCLSLGFTLSSLQCLRRGHGVYQRAIANENVLEAVHELHHAQCVELLRRLTDAPANSEKHRPDIWVHTNEMKAALAVTRKSGNGVGDLGGAGSEVLRLYEAYDAFREKEAELDQLPVPNGEEQQQQQQQPPPPQQQQKIIYDVGGRAAAAAAKRESDLEQHHSQRNSGRPKQSAKVRSKSQQVKQKSRRSQVDEKAEEEVIGDFTLMSSMEEAETRQKRMEKEDGDAGVNGREDSLLFFGVPSADSHRTVE